MTSQVWEDSVLKKKELSNGKIAHLKKLKNKMLQVKEK